MSAAAEYKKIRTAVFPVAGLGTRFLPATKDIPKEMMPLIDRPLIHHGVDEAVASGCSRVVFVTGQGKESICRYFQPSFELTALLREADLVKFAKATPEAARNEEAYQWAYYFVEETKPVEEQPSAEAEEPLDLTPKNDSHA